MSETTDDPADQRVAPERGVPRQHARARGPVEAMYDDAAPRYDRRWSAYIEATVRATAAAIALRPRERLLDVGCGSGALLQHLRATRPGAQTLGIDVSREMLGVARRRLGAGAPLAQADVASLPFANTFFDVVASVSSLHYWAKPERAFDEITRTLKPGGRVILTDWCRDFFTTRLTDRYLRIRQAGYHRAYHASELRRMFETRGLRVYIRRYRIGIWWGMMTAVARPADLRTTC